MIYFYIIKGEGIGGVTIIKQSVCFLVTAGLDEGFGVNKGFTIITPKICTESNCNKLYTSNSTNWKLLSYFFCVCRSLLLETPC